jgi:hypothetical protein
MTWLQRVSPLVALSVGLGACADGVFSAYVPARPSGLFYELEPSGDPDRPRGIVLRWDPQDDALLDHFKVYSRASTADGFGLRGSTSSPSFHDDGVPHLEYFVTAVSVEDGESEASSVVLVDERLRLPAPAALTSVSLDGAIHLEWTDNAFQSDPAGFSNYRIYSTRYDLDNNLCQAQWALEGTTVAASFLAGNLSNGLPRCFGVSAVTIEGFESLWSPLRNDTPRPDGRNVVLFTVAANSSQSGFRFFVDANNDGLAGPLELGIVGPGGSASMDFTITTNTAGEIVIAPQRSNTTVMQYGSGPIEDLTSIDIAPVSGYARAPLVAVPRFGYVFQMVEGDPFARYGAIRVTAVGSDYVIFDWSYQTDPGNPELQVRRPPKAR